MVTKSGSNPRPSKKDRSNESKLTELEGIKKIGKFRKYEIVKGVKVRVDPRHKRHDE